MENRSSHRPKQLSGGEQQRIAVARAMVNDPQVILADEPTGNLDTANSKQVMDLMLSMTEARKATLCLITHDESLAQEIADRVILLQDGKQASQ